jgi:transcriptional regulator with XRE-family HTH domain
MDLNQKTAVRIKEARELKNILQEQFAKAIAMSPSAYSRLENGETQITINALEKIAKELKLNMADLLQAAASQNNTFTKSIVAQNNSTLNITLTPDEFNKIYKKIKEEED